MQHFGLWSPRERNHFKPRASLKFFLLRLIGLRFRSRRNTRGSLALTLGVGLRL